MLGLIVIGTLLVGAFLLMFWKPAEPNGEMDKPDDSSDSGGRASGGFHGGGGDFGGDGSSGSW
jgi:uncharacterized membrane protein YgcG